MAPLNNTVFEPDMLTNLLPIYYKRLFPHSQYYKWLSYGNVSKSYFCNREFSFTIADDIYLRYQSFKDQEEMTKEIQKHCPHKIDIGAIFSYKPKEHKTVQNFTPLEKELVFDIDMTDYDEVRTCCSGAEICEKCWKFMTVAVKILDESIRKDFGYNHLLWVYSGRRGVHCWVCDSKARALTTSQRTALAEYLQLIRGGESQAKKVVLSSRIHPSIKRAHGIIQKYFDSVCLEEQDLLGNSEAWKKILAIIPDQEVREDLDKIMPSCINSEQRWKTISAELTKQAESAKGKRTIRKQLPTEMMLQFLYPRLDINVTKGLNHLLKSPFCIHPKTGRVCVPFDPTKADDFNPMDVPTISDLVEEINAYDKASNENEKKIPDYKKTSMKTCMDVFEQFLNNLSKENAELRLAKNDMKNDF